jgi:hypothetical protein
MNTKYLSFLNSQKSFTTCPDCNENSQHLCKTCVGTGKLCKECSNSGIKNDGNHQIKYCDCGMQNQKTYFWELRSFELQKLFVMPITNDGENLDLENRLQAISKSNYKYISKNNFVYSRYVLASTREEIFIWVRNSYLAKSQAKMQPCDSLRGFIYVNALQFNDSTYVQEIDQIIHMNQSSVITYFGINQSLPQHIYPYYSHITKNLHHPAFFFASQEWYEANKFLHILLIG